MGKWRRRVLLVEDDELTTTLLAALLGQSGFDVETAKNAAEALALVESFDPDAALLDIHLGPGPNGLDLGNLIHLDRPDIGLVFLTKYADPHSVGLDKWQVPEGSAFIPKHLVTDLEFLNSCIENALAGKKLELGGEALAGPLSRLTRVQTEILRLAACGLNNAAIAKLRKTKERTVEKRLAAIYQSLEISEENQHPRVEAVRIYISEAGIPSLDKAKIGEN